MTVDTTLMVMTYEFEMTLESWHFDNSAPRGPRSTDNQRYFAVIILHNSIMEISNSHKKSQ
ncbi:unnamed protein product [Leptidea sinapis]|uniref:Uncharacterized protein n=1 Tax=Leptidea sinapis TaxID=189913 RepID=A0A5E4PUX8_9NEOP|nr:unnamed protein product [Leptidea sinapis]